MPDFRIVDKRHPALPVASEPPSRPAICMVLDPDPKPHATDWCGNAAGHDGLHNWEYCEDMDPHAEYECQHSCRRERGHEPPHRMTFEW